MYESQAARQLSIRVSSGAHHLHVVGDVDEGTAAIHPVVLTVERHCPFSLA
jgi:hypothetical protein